MKAPNQRFSQGLNKTLQLLRVEANLEKKHNISLKPKRTWMLSLVISIFLYACIVDLDSRVIEKTQTFK